MINQIFIAIEMATAQRKNQQYQFYLKEGVNTPLRGDYNHQKDEKWLAFKAKYNLKATDDLFKWYDMYLKLCAAGLL